MVRAHRIPIVGLVLGLACNHRPDDATTTATTTMGTSGAGDGTLGGSDTGAVITTGPAVTTGPDSTTTTTGGLDATGTTSSGTTMPATSTETTSESTTGDDTDASTGTTEPYCYELLGDGAYLPPRDDECDPGSCAPGQVCVRRISCNLVPIVCSPWGPDEGECWVEQNPTACEPIPDECKEDNTTLKDCLEAWSGLCQYGGTYEDGYLGCFYIGDQCQEGIGYQWPFCGDLT